MSSKERCILQPARQLLDEAVKNGDGTTLRNLKTFFDAVFNIPKNQNDRAWMERNKDVWDLYQEIIEKERERCVNEFVQPVTPR